MQLHTSKSSARKCMVPKEGGVEALRIMYGPILNCAARAGMHDGRAQNHRLPLNEGNSLSEAQSKRPSCAKFDTARAKSATPPTYPHPQFLASERA